MMIFRYAIVAKYHGPTNTKGARIRAATKGGSVTIPYDHALDLDDSHAAAARALILKL